MLVVLHSFALEEDVIKNWGNKNLVKKKTHYPSSFVKKMTKKITL